MKFLLFLTAFLFSIAGQGAVPEKLKATTFSTILTEVAQSVGGDRVEVIGQLTWEDNPHEYQITEAAIKAAGAVFGGRGAGDLRRTDALQCDDDHRCLEVSL